MSRPAARKIFKALAWVAIAAVVLVLGVLLSSPWWLGAALKHFGPDYGVTIGQYERQGFGEFILRDVQYKDEDVAVTIESVRLPSLTNVLIQKLIGGESYVIAQDISVTILDPATEGSSQNPGTIIGVNDLAERLNEYLDILDDWPIRLDFTSINALYKSYKAEIPSLEYYGRSGHFSVISEKIANPVNVRFERKNSWHQELLVVVVVGANKIESELIYNRERGTTLSGSIVFQSQKAGYSANWQGEGWLPDAATFSAQNWTLPETILSKEDRQGYAAPQASVMADWDGDSYSLSIEGSAQPEDATLPPLTATVQAEGDLEAVTVQKVDIQGDWVEGQLSEPVTVLFTSLEDLPPFQFVLAVDFDKQSLLPIKGKSEIRLEADDQPGDDTPTLLALFAGKNIQYGDYSVDLIQAETLVDWPLLTVKRFEAKLPEDSSIELQATYDLSREHIESAEAEMTIAGKLVADYGFDEPVFDSMKATFTIDGPRAKPRHQGSLRIEKLAWADDSFGIDLEWQGEHGELAVLKSKGDGELLDFEWEGHASIGLESQNLTLNKAIVQPRDFAELVLQKPVTLTHNINGEASIDELSVAGSQGGNLYISGSVKWPERGNVVVRGETISPVWLRLITDAEMPFPTQLKRIDMAANWDNSPLSYTIECFAEGYPEGQDNIYLEILSQSDGSSVELSKLTFNQGENPLLTAQGDFPLVLDPLSEKLVEIQTKAPANFVLKAKPGATSFWRWLQSRYQIVLENPSLDMQLQGSLNAPQGNLLFTLSKLDFPVSGSLPHIPEITSLQLKSTFSPDALVIDPLEMKICGQALRINGQQPMSRDSWQDALIEGTLPDFRMATVRLDFDRVPIATFEDYLPPVIRPRGTLDINAEIRPGLDWRGQLKLEGAETMPLPQLGALNAIGADLQLAGTTLTVEKASAVLGGREVKITGTVEMPDIFQPQFDLVLKGSEVPFVRAPGLIIRGSPNLTLKTDSNDITTLAGKVQLDESFYTIDLTALGRSNESDPNSRFPYFSVDEEPVNVWRLDIDVEGEGFLRVRTPVFEGIVSADLELRGTLAEPIATGQATINQGIVLFPFANLRIEQGTVSIRQDNPYEPRLDVTANGRAYGYDLVMRLTGTPENPLITFSSTPSLEQGDILLMVTAGRIPDDDRRSTQSRLTGLGIFIGNTILVDMGLIDPLDDRLQVLIGEDVTETGKDTIKVIYRINETWALVGLYDRFEEYNLDLKWTIYQN